MATLTPNYGFTKPAYDEAADVGVINDNMDAIDTALDATDTNVATNASDIDDLEDALGNLKFLRKLSIVKNGGTATFTFSGTASFILLMNGTNASQRSIIWGGCTGSGSVSADKVMATSSDKIGIDTSQSYKLIITNQYASANAYAGMIIITGSTPTVS